MGEEWFSQGLISAGNSAVQNPFRLGFRVVVAETLNRPKPQTTLRICGQLSKIILSSTGTQKEPTISELTCEDSTAPKQVAGPLFHDWIVGFRLELFAFRV